MDKKMPLLTFLPLSLLVEEIKTTPNMISKIAAAAKISPDEISLKTNIPHKKETIITIDSPIGKARDKPKSATACKEMGLPIAQIKPAAMP